MPSHERINANFFLAAAVCSSQDYVLNNQISGREVVDDRSPSDYLILNPRHSCLPPCQSFRVIHHIGRPMIKMCCSNWSYPWILQENDKKMLLNFSCDICQGSIDVRSFFFAQMRKYLQICRGGHRDYHL